MSEVKEPGVNPIPNKGPRKGVVSKDLFLKVLVAALKKHGVCFKQGTKITESKAKYWDLFILFNKIMMAAAASAGTQVSLSGVGTLLFKESGRSEESVFPRFKYKVSSKSKDFFRDNADMVLPGVEGEDGAMNPPTDEDFIANFLKVMEALGDEVADAGTEEIVAKDAVKAPVVDEVAAVTEAEAVEVGIDASMEL